MTHTAGLNRRDHLALRELIVICFLSGLLAPLLAARQGCAQARPGAITATEGVGEPATDSLAPATTGIIRGVVVTQDGTVCEGVQVVLQSAGGGQAAVTGADGRFSIAGVPPGRFELTVAAPGFTTQTVTGELHAGESYETRRIVLTLTRPVSEVRVTATPSEISQEQLREAEHQRVLGIVPNFYVAYDWNAPPLTVRQKFHLTWRELVDPMTLLGTGVSAGMEQAEGQYKGYGKGAAGYARRFGAAYGDNAIGSLIGSSILPTLLHQDPRYFWKGSGSVRGRAWYAIESSFVCRSDRGKRELNYSHLIADFAAAGISNLYYPREDSSSAGEIAERFGTARASDAIENLLQEFVIRRFTRGLHGYGAPKP